MRLVENLRKSLLLTRYCSRMLAEYHKGSGTRITATMMMLALSIPALQGAMIFALYRLVNYIESATKAPACTGITSCANFNAVLWLSATASFFLLAGAFSTFLFRKLTNQAMPSTFTKFMQQLKTLEHVRTAKRSENDGLWQLSPRPQSLQLYAAVQSSTLAIRALLLGIPQVITLIGSFVAILYLQPRILLALPPSVIIIMFAQVSPVKDAAKQAKLSSKQRATSISRFEAFITSDYRSTASDPPDDILASTVSFSNSLTAQDRAAMLMQFSVAAALPITMIVVAPAYILAPAPDWGQLVSLLILLRTLATQASGLSRRAGFVARQFPTFRTLLDILSEHTTASRNGLGVQNVYIQGRDGPCELTGNIGVFNLSKESLVEHLRLRDDRSTMGIGYVRMGNSPAGFLPPASKKPQASNSRFDTCRNFSIPIITEVPNEAVNDTEQTNFVSFADIEDLYDFFGRKEQISFLLIPDQQSVLVIPAHEASADNPLLIRAAHAKSAKIMASEDQNLMMDEL